HTDEEPYPEQLEDLLPKLDDEQNNDYIHTLLDKPDIEPLPSDSQQSIIDSFIAKDEVGEVRLPLEDLQPEPQKTTGKEDALIKEDAFLTESLAKIYIKQKKYSKALEIIKKLSLKY
ncbi:MAG: tetratricopeptide repeat protein, partial [Bacteroidales bacterium]